MLKTLATLYSLYMLARAQTARLEVHTRAKVPRALLSSIDHAILLLCRVVCHLIVSRAIRIHIFRNDKRLFYCSLLSQGNLPLLQRHPLRLIVVRHLRCLPISLLSCFLFLYHRFFCDSCIIAESIASSNLTDTRECWAGYHLSSGFSSSSGYGVQGCTSCHTRQNFYHWCVLQILLQSVEYSAHLAQENPLPSYSLAMSSNAVLSLPIFMKSRFIVEKCEINHTFTAMYGAKIEKLFCKSKHTEKYTSNVARITCHSGFPLCLLARLSNPCTLSIHLYHKGESDDV